MNLTLILRTLALFTLTALFAAPAVRAQTPLIVVEQPVGTALVDGTSTANLGRVQLGFPESRTFTVRNTGGASLSLGGISVDGTDAAEFIADTTGMAAALAPGASTTFRVTFSPTVRAQRSAALHLVSGDSARSPFDVALTAVGIVPGDPDSFNLSPFLIQDPYTRSEYAVASLAVQPDGKLLVGGRRLVTPFIPFSSPEYYASQKAILLRFNTDNTLDSTLMISGSSQPTPAVESILV